MDPQNLMGMMMVYSTIQYLLRFAVLILAVLALVKYLRGRPKKQEEAVQQSLGDTLKAHRDRCGMTQEYVAEALNVTRQAVSKWENGTSDPSTSNLLKLAKLYGVTPGELLRGVEQPDT